MVKIILSPNFVSIINNLFFLLKYIKFIKMSTINAIIQVDTFIIHVLNLQVIIYICIILTHVLTL